MSGTKTIINHHNVWAILRILMQGNAYDRKSVHKQQDIHDFPPFLLKSRLLMSSFSTLTSTLIVLQYTLFTLTLGSKQVLHKYSTPQVLLDTVQFRVRTTTGL